MPHRTHPVWKRFEQAKRRHAGRGPLGRAAVVCGGAALIIGGVLITPLPGPGPALLVPAGVSMLAVQYPWAERLLAGGLRTWIAMQDNARQAGPGMRAAATLTAAAIVTAALLGCDRWVVDLPGI